MPLADAMHAHEAAPSRTNVNGLQADVLQFTNEYAPEHLVIATDDCESYCDGVVNAGSVFLGHWTPESVGSLLWPSAGGAFKCLQGQLG